jgi:L-ribulose-5-phosphate 3-epimerase
MNRRTFLAAQAAPLLAVSPTPIRKAVEFSMLPKSMSVADRFKLARDVGFEQIECPTTPEQNQADEIKKASESAGLPIHSVMNMAHWKYPLNSPDPQVVAESRKGMEISLRNAHFWGAQTVLLVPAVVKPDTSYYQDAWTRSVAEIKKMIPLAKELNVIIGIEEVWNKFLVSPREFAQYVDQFQSPWVRAYFDVGNILLWSYPQDWIRILGKRIVKLHFKDFKWEKMQAKFVPLREGDIDWKEVHKALVEIGYSGTATVELPSGDEAYLKEVSHRFDLILQGA